MVEIQSKEVIDKISEDLKIQPALMIPRKIREDIQLVYDIQPEPSKHFGFGADSTTTGTTTLLTTSTRADTYLTGGSLAVQKAVDNDTTSVILRAKINGANVDLIRLGFITLTAASSELMWSPAKPLKVDRGSTIVLIGAVGVGVIIKSATIQGFEKDLL